MAVTLKDIAERTGVSASVVSTVLSGRDNGTFVSEGTRRKVLQVAELLHYTPVRSGRPRGSRRLRRQHTEQFIGLWDAHYSPGSAYLVQNLQMALREHSRDHGAEAEDDFGLRLLTVEDLPRLDALGIMGLILLSSVPLPRESAVAGIPCVMIGEVDNPARDLIQVHPDNLASGSLLGEYLWSLGHRRIVLLAASATPRVTARRLQGIREIWTAKGDSAALVSHQAYDIVKTLGERDQIRRVILMLFGTETPESERPTALVCDDENIAAVAAQTLAEIGQSVPKQVSLAAFGDTPRMAEALTPSLTVIRPPVPSLAKAAMTALYALHEAETPEAVEERDICQPVQLITRASCASPFRIAPTVIS